MQETEKQTQGIRERPLDGHIGLYNAKNMSDVPGSISEQRKESSLCHAVYYHAFFVRFALLG